MKKDKTPLLLRLVRWGFPKLEAIAPTLAHRYFIRIFFTPLRYKMPEKEKPLDAAAERFTMAFSNGHLQGYAWGPEHGGLVLLVHGWAGRPTQFRKFIERLTSAGYRVIGFDGPAHGRSSGRKTNIIEFEEALKTVFENIGAPLAIIAHSFGGAAVLYAAMNGLPVKRLINIASPTIGEEIINTYLRAINGSKKTGDFFKAYIRQQQGKSFDEYTSLHFVKHLKQSVDLLLVHDEDDTEVYLKQANALLEAYPSAEALFTKGLGHTRILRDPGVIEKCVTFIQTGRLKPETA